MLSLQSSSITFQISVLGTIEVLILYYFLIKSITCVVRLSTQYYARNLVGKLFTHTESFQLPSMELPSIVAECHRQGDIQERVVLILWLLPKKSNTKTTTMAM